MVAPRKPSASDIERLLQTAYEAFLGGRRDDAEKALRRILELDPANTAAWNNLASLLSDSGLNTEAEAAYRKAIALNPAHPDFHSNLGNLLRATGRPSEAEASYREAIRLNPKEASNLALLAQLLKEIGRLEDAEKLFRQALVLDPRYALGHNNLGILLKETDRAAEAEAAYRRALELNPAFPEAHNNLGIMLLNDERFAEAEAAFRRAMELQPELADAHSNLGNVLKRTERLTEAEASYRRALELSPGFAEAHNNLGLLLKQADKAAEAEAAYRSALELKPDFAEAHNNLGIVLFGEERFPEAEAELRRAIEIKPDLADAHGNLGNLLKQVKRLDEAETAYRQALAIDPDDAGIHNNLAILLSQTQRLREAETAFRRATEIKPEFTEAHNNFGNLLKEMGRLQDAEDAYRRALELKPGHTDTRLNLGILLLTLGRYAEGWPHYNAGHTPDTKARRDMRPPFSFPEWQGEPLKGKSLVIVIEQGAGDNVQFVRYAPLLKAQGVTRLSYFQPGAFIPLLATAHGIDFITPDSAIVEEHDYWCFPLSLPMHLGTTLDTIPDTLPYLWALPERIDRWRPRLPASGLKVGLVWKGNPDHMNDANRSLPHLSVLAPLWEVPGISFVSLQKGQGEDEARQPPPGQPLLHLGNDIADFADTAAIVAQLDLVITVDSAAAHVAGALGKPVWVLLPGFGTDWRWLLEREDSPWYPGAMRLFRQPHEATSWDDTVRGVAAALRTWSAAPPARAIPVSDHGAVPATLPPAPPPPPAAEDPFAAALAAYQSGRHDDAESILRGMLADNPADAGGWNNLGNLLQETGRFREAESAFTTAISIQPDQPSFHSNLGNLLALDGQFGGAEAAYNRAIALDPGNAGTHNQLGSLLNKDKRPEEAEAAFRRAIELAPDFADAHNNLGILFKSADNRVEAEASYRRALELNPGFAEAYNNLGILLLEDERFAEAEVALRRALELKPEFPDVHSNLGNLLKQTKRLAEAEASYRRAIELKPDDATAQNNLGVLLHEAEQLDAADAAYRRALELNPDFADAHSNLGILLQRLGRFGEAEAAYHRAIDLKPDCTDAKLNLGLLLLALGRYAEAWPWHEARHFPDNKARRAMQPPFTFPQWQGESLAGRSLVVVLEQGAGDNIQFVRYAPLLKAQGLARLTFVEPSALVPLLATASGLDAVLADVSTMPTHDYWCFPLSLPMHLGTTLENIPDTLPYLWALPERIDRWRPHLPVSGLKVGLVWKGNPDHKNDANRSLPHISVLAPLWEVPGISFISLQKGQGEDEARQPPPGQPLLHLGDDIADFADTAAIVAQLDLVITVDSAAAHVAGALGKPVWVLLPGFGTDWRWMLEREDSPWYPGAMRLFRQPRDATSWDDTVRGVAAALRTWSAAPPALAVPLTRYIGVGTPVVTQEAAVPAAPAGIDALMEAARVAYLAGRRDEAATRLREVLAIDDANPVAWTNLAGILADAGTYDEAEAAYRRGAALNPDFADLHVNFARYLEGRGRPAEAESAYRAALALRPDDVTLHNNLGVLLFNAGRFDDAEPFFRGAATRDPKVPTYWNNLGNGLRMQQRFTEAEAAYRKALALLPDDNLLLNNLAVALGECGRDEEALVLLRRITTLAPYYPDGWNNLGTSLQKLGHYRDAEAAYGKAIAIHPGFAAAHANLGNLLDGQRRLPEAEAEYRRATALDPGFISAHWNLALLMLNQGRWAEAWPWFERRNDPFKALRNDRFGCPEWRGEDLAGKSLLIDSVEGQGDNIMCARYVALLKRAGATRITLIHRAPLKPLLETVEGVDAVVQEPPPPGRFDYWCFSFSLLARFGTTPETIPATIPYLAPLASRMSYWQRKLETVKGFRVGLVWRGDPVNDVDRHRSLQHISVLAPLWKIPGVSFVSLQKGRGEDEAKPPPADQPMVHLGDDIADFADTAAIISQLDLLITVDTAPAHVAGALGRPVWVMLPATGTDWRWLRDREDTPWYPGAMRLFRQLQGAPDWQAVVEDIAAALAAKTTGTPEPSRAPAPAPVPPAAETALRPPNLSDSPLEPSMNRPALRPAAFVLASSDHGTLIVNRNDYADQGGGNMIGVGCQVLFNSSFDRDEVDLALRMLEFRRRLFGDGVMALDCGANIGVHTVEWAKQMHGWGSVIAVEAQERVFYALAGNITINNCFNARAIWGAVGAENGEIIVPRPDYLRPGSYGSMEIRPSVRNEFIGQPIDYSEESGVKTRLFTIDSLALPRVDFIKIDIEGMEMEALAGAMGTIRRFRPQMIIEKIKSDESALRNLLIAEGYRVAPFTGNLVAIHGSDPSHAQLLA